MTNVDILEVVYSVLASSYLLTSKQQRSLPLEKNWFTVRDSPRNLMLSGGR